MTGSRTTASAIATRLGDTRPRGWSERQAKVRDELVDATFRALAAIGPTASMDDVAREAGVAKPKLYRYFEDKADLYTAVAERIQDILWTRIFGKINLLADSARELVQHGAAEYARIVVDYPNVLRFIVHGHFGQSTDEPERLLASVRHAVRQVAEVLSDAVDGKTLDIESADLAMTTAVGAIGSATDWWVDADQQSTEAMSVERFGDYVATVLLGLIDSIAKFNGLELNTEVPLHEAFTPTPERGR